MLTVAAGCRLHEPSSKQDFGSEICFKGGVSRKIPSPLVGPIPETKRGLFTLPVSLLRIFGAGTRVLAARTPGTTHRFERRFLLIVFGRVVRRAAENFPRRSLTHQKFVSQPCRLSTLLKTVLLSPPPTGRLQPPDATGFRIGTNLFLVCGNRFLHHSPSVGRKSPLDAH